VQTHKITAKQASDANAVPLPTQTHYPESNHPSYYTDALLEQLTHPNPAQPANPANALGKTRKAAINKLYNGGLRIYTNDDPAMELAANVAISDIVPKNQTQFTATVVSIDNSNGAVRAIAFGKGYSASQFDPAVDGPGRQAGSSFKGITLAAALSKGYSADDRVSGGSITWQTGPGTGSGSYYHLSGDCHGGDPTLTDAIAISDNCAFVRTELSMGPGHYGADGAQQVEDMASRMGIDISHFANPPVVSTTLGTNGVHMLEMAQAYSVIAADGVLHPAQFVSKIVGPNGKVLWENTGAGTRVLAPEIARTETQMLTEVLKRGTASGLSIGRPAAGKTGTTDQKADAWFIGYTPQLTTAVWMGDPLQETPMTNVGGIAVFGATYPADIWKQFMESVLGNQPVVDFAAPDEALWPTRQFIDEYGRRYSTRYVGNPTVTTATLPPVTVSTLPTGPATTAPPFLPPTTPPSTPTTPATKPKKTPGT
jgi:penicillin-binding protein 1A